VSGQIRFVPQVQDEPEHGPYKARETVAGARDGVSLAGHGRNNPDGKSEEMHQSIATALIGSPVLRADLKGPPPSTPPRRTTAGFDGPILDGRTSGQ
jgi:hypothetical protein